MQAFFANRSIRPQAWEVDAIVMLDHLSRGTLIEEPNEQ